VCSTFSSIHPQQLAEISCVLVVLWHLWPKLVAGRGGKWPGRLALLCQAIMGEVGEDEIYQQVSVAMWNCGPVLTGNSHLGLVKN
jgi:hypothetical protein